MIALAAAAAAAAVANLNTLLVLPCFRCVEESLVAAFTEARRAAPAIIYWPQVQ
jgi:hypothetical protein